MKRTALQTKPYTMNSDEPRFKILGTEVTVKVGTEQTGGAFNLFDVLCPSGFETPLHIHYMEDVALYILEGMLDLYWGNEKKQALTSSFCFQPRGMPHGFRVAGTTHARILYMTFPAGFDKYVIERSRSATEREAMSLEARYKIEILGPLPD